MKEHPIIFSTDMVKAILEDRKTQTRRVVTPKTSVIGEGGDWSKLCWDGSTVHIFPSLTGYTPIKKQEKAPLPFVDDGFWEKDHSSPMYLHVPYNWADDMTIYRVYCRYDVGDRLWVRETHHLHDEPRELTEEDLFTWVSYKADSECHLVNRRTNEVEEFDVLTADSEDSLRWRPSIHMPRWVSRITLEITEIRVERLQEISLEDVKAEGILPNPTDFPFTVDLIEATTPRLYFASYWDSLNAKRGYGWEVNPWVWVIGFRRL